MFFVHPIIYKPCASNWQHPTNHQKFEKSRILMNKRIKSGYNANIIPLNGGKAFHNLEINY